MNNITCVTQQSVQKQYAQKIVKRYSQYRLVKIKTRT